MFLFGGCGVGVLEEYGNAGDLGPLFFLHLTSGVCGFSFHRPVTSIENFLTFPLCSCSWVEWCAQ